jgi:hypothetical protein
MTEKGKTNSTNSDNTSNNNAFPWKKMDKGTPIEITTKKGECIDGYLYIYDKVTQLIVLIKPLGPKSSKFSFQLVKEHLIEKFSFPKQNKFRVFPAPHSNINLEKLAIREAKAVQEIERKISRVGVNVSNDAQNIFDALSKTLPCSWQKQSILVMGEILISSPYKVENCVGTSSSLSHVKKVLSGERKRLGLEGGEECLD